MRVQHYTLTGHLIVVVFPLIKIHNQLILLFGHIRFQNFSKTASVIMNANRCRYSTHLYTLSIFHYVHIVVLQSNCDSTIYFGLLCRFLATIWIPVTMFHVFMYSWKLPHISGLLLCIQCSPIVFNWKLFVKHKMLR